MKPSEKTISKLTNFFRNVHLNDEASFGEVEVFLNDYLKYIFELNGLDISKYDISICKVKIGEIHSGREATYKRKCNSEERKRERLKVFNKKSYVSDGTNNHFDAIMVPSKTVENKFTIYVNENSCRMKSDDDLEWLINLFQIFGHEAHHIIQFIKFKYDMDCDDEYMATLEAYKEVAPSMLDKNQSKILTKLINRHLDLYNLMSKIETKADKKGYDYLDILFNDIIARMPKPTRNERDFHDTDSKFYKSKHGREISSNDKFYMSICSYQDINEDIYNSRLDQYELELAQNEGLTEQLIAAGVDPYDLVYPSLED